MIHEMTPTGYLLPAEILDMRSAKAPALMALTSLGWCASKGGVWSELKACASPSASSPRGTAGATRTQRAEDLVEKARLLIRVGLVEETGHHVREGRRLVRVERVSEPIGELAPRHGRRHLIVCGMDVGRRRIATCDLFQQIVEKTHAPSVRTRLPRPLRPMPLAGQSHDSRRPMRC